MVIPIEINIKIGDFNYHFNLNLEIKEVNTPLKELPIEIHPEILKDGDKE